MTRQGKGVPGRDGDALVDHSTGELAGELSFKGFRARQNDRLETCRRAGAPRGEAGREVTVDQIAARGRHRILGKAVNLAEFKSVDVGSASDGAPEVNLRSARAIGSHQSNFQGFVVVVGSGGDLLSEKRIPILIVKLDPGEEASLRSRVILQSESVAVAPVNGDALVEDRSRQLGS